MEVLPGYVDMALSSSEKKAEATAISPSPPMYPYGLCISLGTEQLQKLGLADDVEAGDHIQLNAIGKVTSVSKHDTESGCDCRVEIQLTAIEAEDEDTTGEEMAEDMPAPKGLSYKKMYSGK